MTGWSWRHRLLGCSVWIWVRVVVFEEWEAGGRLPLSAGMPRSMHCANPGGQGPSQSCGWSIR